MNAQPPLPTLVHDVAISVGLDLQEAVAAYGVYQPSAAGIDFEALRKSDFSQGFMVVRASLYRVVLLALCRLWDQGASGRYSLKKLLDLVENAEVIKAYNIAEKDTERLRAAYKKVIASQELKSIKATRDSWIAHTASRARIAQQEVRPAVYGDELRLIEMTAPIAYGAAAAVKCAHIPLANDQKIWRQQGLNFWAQVFEIS